MKKTVLLQLVVLTFFLTGCMETRYITEKYIKTNIENHKRGDFSSIRTYSIYQQEDFKTGSYLEFTGYKYESKKAMIIGADKYYKARQKFIGDNTVIAEVNYIELDMKQCQSILDNYKILEDKLKNEGTISSEEVYQDFTVSNDMFISLKKGGMISGTFYIYVWIRGDKYSIETDALIRKLKKFMNY